MPEYIKLSTKNAHRVDRHIYEKIGENLSHQCHPCPTRSSGRERSINNSEIRIRWQTLSIKSERMPLGQEMQ